MPQIEHKAVFGLELQSNSFQVHEGSLEVAENIIVSQDNIYKKVRGQKTFVDPSPVELVTMTEYQDKLVGICSDRVQIYNQAAATGEYTSTSTLTNDTGVTVAVSDYSRVTQSNGNAYFTSDNGAMKLESYTGKVFHSGIAKALDLECFRTVTNTYETYLKPDSQVGYKVVFLRKDANQNTVIGTPSQMAVVTNALTQTAKSYSVSGTTVTVTATSHGIAIPTPPGTYPFNVWLYIKNATGHGIVDLAYLASVTDANTFTFTVPTGADNTGTRTLDWGQFKQAKIRFTTPTPLKTTEYAYQVYRTDASAVISIDPDESTLQLVDEVNLVASDLPTDVSGVGFVTYYDTTADTLRQGYLYNNPNTGEGRGVAENNEVPPTSTDIELFKNHVFYANCQTFYRLPLNLLASDSVTMPSGAKFTIKNTGGATTRTFTAYTTGGNLSVTSSSVLVALNTVTVTYANHGLANLDTIAIIEAVNSSEVQDSVAVRAIKQITYIDANNFSFTVTGTPSAIAHLSFFGLFNAAGERMFYAGQSDVTGTTGLSTLATAIDATSRAIVKAINMDASKVCNAFYVSSVDDVPGKMVLESTGTSTSFYVNSLSSAIVDTFLPSIPLSGTTVAGTRDDERGVIYISKYLEPESCPIYGKIFVGSKADPILRIKALRDSLIVLKKSGGAYRINGSSIDTFVATILDSTVSCVASDSVVVLNNQVFTLTEQGVCAISETAASIVSRQIEPVLTAIVGKVQTTVTVPPDSPSVGTDLVELNTHGIAYESERLYMLSTMTPQSEETDVVYIYNFITNAWSTRNDPFFTGFVKPSDNHLYLNDLDNVISRERKNNDKLDFTGAQFNVTVLTTPSTTTATLSISGGTASIGDVLVINSIINRITDITVSGGTTTYTFAVTFSFAASDTGILYKSITSTIRTSPIHGGQVSSWKQFSELQATYRYAGSVSRMTMNFISDSQAGTVDTLWISQSTSGGWGNEPWGNFPWGLEEGIDTVYSSSQAQPIRIYVPLEMQRSTFLQCIFTHDVAAEPIMLQSIALTARPYGQRTTR